MEGDIHHDARQGFRDQALLSELDLTPDECRKQQRRHEGQSTLLPGRWTAHVQQQRRDGETEADGSQARQAAISITYHTLSHGDRVAWRLEEVSRGDLGYTRTVRIVGPQQSVTALISHEEPIAALSKRSLGQRKRQERNRLMKAAQQPSSTGNAAAGGNVQVIGAGLSNRVLGQRRRREMERQAKQDQATASAVPAVSIRSQGQLQRRRREAEDVAATNHDPAPYGLGFMSARQPDEPLAKMFRTDIWKYNRALAFTSLGVTQDHTVNKKSQSSSARDNNLPPVFRISGELCHRISAMVPLPGITPTYSQLYVLDPDTALEQRIKNNIDLNRTVMADLQGALYQHHQYVPVYRQAFEILSQYDESDDVDIRL
ncbi:hypothetical protein BKA70DRAFT_1451538 [Coprinopsis sp. MPI-PUGE-AT-0042]|nr:hypothetical protein BKA70DRAFT_1451538 [Coprinopsis sp. MPI-PUGE-AT-0042]